MNTEDKQPPENIVEHLIDNLGLHDLLVTINVVCQQKAEHIRANWQDEPLAEAWEQAGDYIEEQAEIGPFNLS